MFSPGAPVPSLPSSTPASRLKPPSMVVVWIQRLSGSPLQALFGGVAEMLYVAGDRSLICMNPSSWVVQSPGDPVTEPDAAEHSGRLW
jgi:hypothetical protein